MRSAAFEEKLKTVFRSIFQVNVKLLKYEPKTQSVRVTTFFKLRAFLRIFHICNFSTSYRVNTLDPICCHHGFFPFHDDVLPENMKTHRSLVMYWKPVSRFR